MVPYCRRNQGCAEAQVESGEVDALVPERVTAEIRKALKEAKPSIFFDELETNGFMGRVYPEWKQTELSRSLLDGLSSSFTEEEKFAASVASVDPNKLPALLEALRMPKKLTEFALLFSESLRDGFECASDGKECFPFFVVRMRCGARSGLLSFCAC